MIWKTIKGLRSQAECATYCFGEDRCAVAVYKANGICDLVEDFYTNLNVTEQSNGKDKFVVFRDYDMVRIFFLRQSLCSKTGVLDSIGVLRCCSKVKNTKPQTTRPLL